nr:LuxR C-terminal-related transcriptional regulator [Allgaiera sp.]
SASVAAEDGLEGQAAYAASEGGVLALTRPQVQRPPRSRLGAALSLTPAEAAVALMLAEGLSPVEIADQRGTRLVTVRNQIKQAMWKADCRRQVDLVRRVLTLTGPGTGPASAAPHRPQ